MKELSDNDLKTIIARRDRRFDGRFFFGVKTTRIYCRPICPARPKPENIVIFRSLSEAENKGYRPCLRCRPDVAPGSRLLAGTMNTVARALRIILDTTDDGLSVETMATSLGVTDRHLRRLFDEHLGASPIEIMTTQRLHFAKQVLRETQTPITAIAFAAGFRSVRRFNEAFKGRYRTSPSEFRKNQGTALADVVTLRIPIRLPYDWSSVLAYLKRHETYGLELVENDSYRRFVPRGTTFGSVVVTQDAKRGVLLAQFVDIPLKDMRGVLTRIKSVFDTDHNPSDIPATGQIDPRGIRVPAGYDPFETAVAIILSQLVSTEQAKFRLRKLIERFGQALGTFGQAPVYAFPTPQALATALLETVGLTRTRSTAIRQLSQALLDGSLDFKSHQEFSLATRRLLEIKGIGPWTASMIAMRCLGNPDAFPEFDLIVQRALAQKLAVPSDWGSSRAYLVHCLWRDFGATLSKAKGAKT